MPFDSSNFPSLNPHPIYSLEGLAHWLQGKEGIYAYYNCTGKCLLGQYLSERLNGPWLPVGTELKDVPRELRIVSAREPWTFPAALARVEQLLEARR